MATPNPTPNGVKNPFADPTQRAPRKLVLCFDGTGNQFMGNTSDTNIVKLYDKLDRKNPDQYHYYQTGIGTYDIGGGSINKGFFGGLWSSISRKLDSGFATTFDAHVIAGYRFIMRYYKEGDKIYIFGFSRGAFTARFLARMIFTVGLLSEGNEEMVPFAYDLYQQYEQGQHDTEDNRKIFSDKLSAFKMTFCRCYKIHANGDESPENMGVKVHFLGMFDCVSSVAVLDSVLGKVPKAVAVNDTAHHVRHAVAVDEHRVKFRAALLHRDGLTEATKKEDIKEVWFPGNHGDVGGGWPAEVETTRTRWENFCRTIFGFKEPKPSKLPAEDQYQMSDVPLAWMIRELEQLGEKDEASAIHWSSRKDGFKKHFYQNKQQAYTSIMHSTLKIGHGSSLFKVMLWNLMEWLPIRRWEFLTKKKGWEVVAWPPNSCGTRDIPSGALLHDSLLKRLQNFSKKDAAYRPCNNEGDSKLPPSLSGKDYQASMYTCYEKDNGEDEHEGSPGVHSIHKVK